MSRKDPMPGILDDVHPGCFYKDHGIVPIINSKRYVVIGPDGTGNCTQLKVCNNVDTAKKWIRNRPKTS
jgi:ABC-type phosphate transport system ATPase subunit